MIKKFIVSLSLLLSLVSFAQEGTSSPYSFYGIGDVRFRGTVETRSMGGLSVLQDSIHMSLQNPALLSSVKLTSFTVGGTYTKTNLKTETAQESSKRTTFDYLAIALPSKKFGFSIGVMPYSSVGYKIKSVSADENPVTTRYNGLGGINKVFTGVGYQINKYLSIGAEVQYNFGEIQTNSLSVVDGVQYGSREKDVSDVTGVTFNTGISFNTKLTKKLSLVSGLIYAPESNLKLDNTRNIAVVQLLYTGGELVVEGTDVAVANTKLKMPSKLTFGTAIGELRKWMVGSEVSFIGSSNMSNRFDDITNVSFENSTKLSIGGYYVPKYNSFRSYFDKITYRGGFRYENTGLVFNNKSINDQAFTIGLGLPLMGTFSNINIGFEYGKRGTIYSGLVEENYGNLSIGLSFNDRWFQKRKID